MRSHCITHIRECVGTPNLLVLVDFSFLRYSLGKTDEKVTEETTKTK